MSVHIILNVLFVNFKKAFISKSVLRNNCPRAISHKEFYLKFLNGLRCRKIVPSFGYLPTSRLLYFLYLHQSYMSMGSTYYLFTYNRIKINKMYTIEASCGAAARSVTVKPTGCGFDPHSRR